jgi:hypothetical protein
MPMMALRQAEQTKRIAVGLLKAVVYMPIGIGILLLGEAMSRRARCMTNDSDAAPLCTASC